LTLNGNAWASPQIKGAFIGIIALKYWRKRGEHANQVNRVGTKRCALCGVMRSRLFCLLLFVIFGVFGQAEADGGFDTEQVMHLCAQRVFLRDIAYGLSRNPLWRTWLNIIKFMNLFSGVNEIEDGLIQNKYKNYTNKILYISMVINYNKKK